MSDGDSARLALGIAMPQNGPDELEKSPNECSGSDTTVQASSADEARRGEFDARAGQVDVLFFIS